MVELKSLELKGLIREYMRALYEGIIPLNSLQCQYQQKANMAKFACALKIINKFLQVRHE